MPSGSEECEGLPPSPVNKKPCGCAGKADARAGAPITPPSCLECVEKHLGAAWVLIAEHRDGYSHRLRAIGHLHEAEDESQAWPELHNAIRTARKAYQREGKMPEFAALARQVSNLTAVGDGARVGCSQDRARPMNRTTSSRARSPKPMAGGYVETRA
jgi:hypothetical protein